MEINNILNLKISYYYGGFIKLDEYWNYKDVRAIFSKCYFVLDGRLQITTDKEVIIGTPNTLIIIPAGLRHDVSCPFEDKATKYWIHFGLEADGKSMFDLMKVPFTVQVTDTDTTYVSALFEQILECAKGQDLTSHMLLQSHCFSLLAYYFKAAGVNFLVGERNTNVSMLHIADYIQEHLSAPPAVAELARMCHFNTSYFIRIFNETFGYTPRQYIKRLQMEHAKKLLEDSNLSVNRVAASVGFSDVKHFSKAFKAYSNFSPKAYREMGKKYKQTQHFSDWVSIE